MSCWADFAKFIKSPMFKKATDVGVEKGEYEGSVQSDKSTAMAEYSVALGNGNTAGTMAFTIKAISGNTITLDSVQGLSGGMTCSAQVTNMYNSFGKITSINGNNITVDTIFTGYTLDADSALWIPDRPDLGTKSIGSYGVAFGMDNNANQTGSFASGRENIADGKYSFVAGLRNLVGYLGVAFGQGNKVFGFNSAGFGDNNTIGKNANNSVATGYLNNVGGANSFASGYGNHATSTNSFVIGNTNVAGNKNCFAGGNNSQTYHPSGFVFGDNLYTGADKQIVFGQYNSPNASDVFQVGGGNADNNRWNAFRVLKDGRAKIKTGPSEWDDVANKSYVDGRTSKIPISRGGTNATTAEGARSNLGVSRVRCTHVKFTVSANNNTEVSFTADADVVGYTVSLMGLSSTAGSYESMMPSLIDKVSVAGIYKSNSADKKKMLAHIKSTHSATLYGQVCIMYVTA
jgi:hypothetical protein